MGAKSKTPERRIRTDVLGGSLTLALGLLTVGTGVYFLVLRPPLLPEDIRRTGIDQGALPPAFLDWLGIVFHTWGGFIAGFGISLLEPFPTWLDLRRTGPL